MGKIKSVSVDPGCVSCCTCQIICPEVFEIQGTAQVRQDASFEKNEENIRQAASLCPVNVIHILEEESR